ncbi:MAG: addiction module antitoxin [Wenzhouxiangellaceae bacterium]|nr:addiction module antitoxin [Wenzhouxiangellaceae bacterium]
MSSKTTLTVRLGGALGKHVADAVGEEFGRYENVSEYVRDLIRRDLERAEQDRFETLRSELQLAFAEPESSYVKLDAREIIRRNEASE